MYAAVIGPFQVYATDAYTTVGNSAVLSCLLPPELSWALQVTHWLAGSHMIHSHQIPQRKLNESIIGRSHYLAISIAVTSSFDRSRPMDD